MKKEVDVESGAFSQENLDNNELCRSSGPDEKLVGSEHVCELLPSKQKQSTNCRLTPLNRCR